MSEPKVNLYKAIEGVSGLRKPDVDKIFAEVKANNARLDSCPGPHDFQPIPTDRPMPRDFLCSKCQGKVDVTRKIWYEQGLAHGRAEHNVKAAQVRQ